MIKVKRIKKPKELTDKKQRQLTEEFKRDKHKQVWNKKYIRKRLLKECNGKCVYCEVKIGGDRDMQIDHFHYKNKYEEEVVLWENLNPSCQHCNRNKSSHDTYLYPIINPFEQNPQDYFCVREYRYYSKNDEVEEIVRTTIDVLGLNDTREIVANRFQIGNELLEKMQQLHDLAEEKESSLCSNVRIKNRVLNGLKNLLILGTKEEEYSAFMATAIKNDIYYKKLKILLTKLELWNNELQELDKKVDEVKLQMGRDQM